MAIVGITDVRARKFSGYEDPRYPTGYHRTDFSVIGDATGGLAIAQLDFAKVSELRNSQYYSLDELRIVMFVGAIHIAEMEIFNFDSLVTTRWSLALAVSDTGFASMSLQELGQATGIFLGQQEGPLAATAIQISVTNINGVLLRAMAGGYIWSARSTSVEGGPQRPPTGLYRS